MRPRPAFWCKCHDAFQAAWEKAMKDAAAEVWRRTNKMTDKYFTAIEEDAPIWRFKGDAV